MFCVICLIMSRYFHCSRFSLLRWLSRLQSCPNCKKPAVAGDIRKIYAPNILIVTSNQEGNVQKELDTVKCMIEKLKRLGIEYTECSICDAPFLNTHARQEHVENRHIHND